VTVLVAVNVPSVAVTPYPVAEEATDGVPAIAPVDVLMVSPGGSDGAA
jgi:hypothetical protein